MQFSVELVVWKMKAICWNYHVPTTTTFLEFFNIWLENVHFFSCAVSFLFLENSFWLLLNIPQNCIFLLFYVWLKCFSYENFPQKLFFCPRTTFVKWFLINIGKYPVFFIRSSLMKFCSLFRNPWKKVFFHSFIFKRKLPKTKYLSYLPRHVWEVGSWLKSQNVYFFCFMEIKLL